MSETDLSLLESRTWLPISESTAWPDAELVSWQLISSTSLSLEQHKVCMANSQSSPDLHFEIHVLDGTGSILTFVCSEVEQVGPLYLQQEISPEIIFARDRVRLSLYSNRSIPTICRSLRFSKRSFS